MALEFNTNQVVEIIVDGKPYEVKKVSVYRRAEMLRELGAKNDDAVGMADLVQTVLIEAGLPLEVYKTLLPEHIEALNNELLGGGEKKN